MDCTQVFDPKRLTGELLDRLTHYVSILAMNGDNYRLKQSARRRRAAAGAEQNQTTETIDPDTGKITIPWSAANDMERSDRVPPHRHPHINIGLPLLRPWAWNSATVDIPPVSNS